jgi:hypothetical protein
MRKEKKKKSKERNTHSHKNAKKRAQARVSKKCHCSLLVRIGVWKRERECRGMICMQGMQCHIGNRVRGGVPAIAVQREASGLCDRVRLGKPPHGWLHHQHHCCSIVIAITRALCLSFIELQHHDEVPVQRKELDRGWMDRRNESGLLGRNVETR